MAESLLQKCRPSYTAKSPNNQEKRDGRESRGKEKSPRRQAAKELMRKDRRNRDRERDGGNERERRKGEGREGKSLKDPFR